MGKNQSASGLTNVIQYNNGNITFVSGSTTLMSISSSGAITTTGVISGSNVLTASYANNAELLDGLDSTAFATTGAYSATSGSLYTVSSSAYATSGSLSTASGSFNTRVSALEATGSALSSSILSVSSSAYATSGSLSAASGSFNSRVASLETYSTNLTAKTASFATTGSNTFIGSQVVSGSLTASGSITATGTITAQTLVVQTITSSVVYSSGSNVFGNDIGNSQRFTGSVLITGSLTIAGGSSATSYSGTTIYGSTVVCSPVGKFTSCIDAGSGTFSSSVTATQLSVNTTNTTGKINIQGPNDSGLLYLFNSSANARFMFNNYYGYGIDAMIIQEFNTSNVLQRDIIAFAACGKVGIGTALPTTALEVSSADLNNIFVTNPTTTGTTTGSGIGFKAYNGTSVAQAAGIILTSNTWSYGTYSANQLSIGADGTGGLALRTANSAPIAFFTGCTTAGLSAERMRITCGGIVLVGVTDGLTTSTYTGKLAVFTSGAGANIAIGTGVNTNNAVMSRFITVNTNNGNSGNESSTSFYGITSIESALTTSNSNASGNSGGYIMFKTKGDAGTLDERMRITSDGITCFSGVVCAPRLEILRSSANNGLFIYSNSGATAIGCTMAQINGLTNDSTGNILTLASLNDGIRMVVRNDGNVGIGTTSPTGKLTIYNDGAVIWSTYMQTPSTSNKRNSFGFFDYTCTIIASILTDVNVDNTSNFGINTGPSNTNRLTISSTGIASFTCQVCAPTFKGGSFNGTTGYFSCHIELNDNGSGWIYAVDKNHSIILRGDRTGCVADFTNHYQYGGNLSTGKGHNFWTDGVLASQTLKMQIANNGICMTVPLYVCANGSAFGTAAGSGQAMTIQAGSNCRAILFKNPAGGDGSLWLYGVSNSIDYSFSTYSVGSAFYLYNNGNYDFAGSDVSDIRLKENITTIDYNATEKLMQLVPKSYNMTKHPDTKRSGFIAQEVKEVLPDFVTGEETEKDYLGLDYNGLLAISIKAIQEQQCTINTLKTCLGIS